MTERRESVAAAFRAGAQSYKIFGSPLYSALCRAGAGDLDIIDLAAHAQAGAQPVFHLLTAIHYLLLGNPEAPLAQYFPTLTPNPLPPDEAAAAFIQYCRSERADIVNTLRTTTVQTTFAERCATIVLPIARVADEAGEPLHLIEIGCSAGVLLTFDRYAYAYDARERFGDINAPITFTGAIEGNPPLRIPQIASRTGLDLHPVDARNSDEYRWLIAQIFPEYGQQRRDLEIALAVVNDTDIAFYEGDAMDTLPGILAATGDPVCIFHSVCLSYWTDEARRDLDILLTHASRERTLYRVGSEPSAAFSAWNKGHDRARGVKPPPAGEITISRYRGGEMISEVVATNGFGQPIVWRGWHAAS